MSDEAAEALPEIPPQTAVFLVGLEKPFIVGTPCDEFKETLLRSASSAQLQGGALDVLVETKDHNGDPLTIFFSKIAAFGPCG